MVLSHWNLFEMYHVSGFDVEVMHLAAKMIKTGFVFEVIRKKLVSEVDV